MSSHPTNDAAPPRAVVLLSGGVDSATTLAVARNEGFECFALSVDYGQRHRSELEAARRVARHLHASRHLIVQLDLREIGGSALTDEIDVPKDRDESDLARGIPVTYVPARNTILLSIALAWAETIAARTIFVGANAVDYSGYPDCRPRFIEAFETLANVATKAGVEGDRFAVRAPLIALGKAEIIRLGHELGVDFALTTSCYDPDESGRACGRCDSCIIRRRGFDDAGVPDSTPYAHAEADR